MNSENKLIQSVKKSLLLMFNIYHTYGTVRQHIKEAPGIPYFSECILINSVLEFWYRFHTSKAISTV